MSGLNLQAVWRRAFSLPVTRQPWRAWLRPFLALSCAFSALLAAQAQDTNTPSLQYSNTPALQYPTTPPLPQAVETNLPPPPPPPVYLPEAPPAPALTGTRQLYVPSAVPRPALPPLLRWGPLIVQPHLFYSLSYGNGLQASPGHLDSSFLNEIDPGIFFRWGDHWTLDYTPMLRFYSSSEFRNTFDNSVILTGGTTYEDWTFGLSQSYISSSDPIIETAGQVDQQAFSTRLSASYQMSSKTSLELGASQDLRFVDQTIPGEQLSNYATWSTTDWLNYQFWSRFGAAIGVGFGYTDVSDSPDMTFEQIQARITWRVVDKLSLVLIGGGQDLQFLNSGAPSLLSPIFSLSVQYSLFDVTTLSINAYSAVTPSYFQDQVTEGTSIGAGLHQRLLGRFYLDLNGGYANSTYHASTTSPASTLSNYDTTFFSAQLSAPVLKRGTVSVFYSANYNSSGAAIYNYNTSMVGFALTYRY